jgi:hypothetical protein
MTPELFRAVLLKQVIQWKPLNVITLVQSQSDNINGMITITEQTLAVYVEKLIRQNSSLQPELNIFSLRKHVQLFN